MNLEVFVIVISCLFSLVACRRDPSKSPSSRLRSLPPSHMELSWILLQSESKILYLPAYWIKTWFFYQEPNERPWMFFNHRSPAGSVYECYISDCTKFTISIFFALHMP